MQATETLTRDRLAKVKQAKQTIDEHLKGLAEAMRQGKSDELTRYLTFFSQFHHYSFGNLMLALFQRPSITHLAGMRQWNKVGRTVIPGEHGIVILAPMKVKRKELEELLQEDGTDAKRNDRDKEERKPAGSPGRANGQETVTYYKPVYVFDVAQTRGEDLPTLCYAQGDASALMPALERFVRQASIQIEYVEAIKRCPGALGVSLGGRIQIRAGLSEAERFSTLVHEYAHEVLHYHSGETDKRVQETEADATAYVVCKHFGIECNTSDYLLLYDAKPELIYERMETIRHTARWVIDQVEDDVERMAQYR